MGDNHLDGCELMETVGYIGQNLDGILKKYDDGFVVVSCSPSGNINEVYFKSASELSRVYPNKDSFGTTKNLFLIDVVDCQWFARDRIVSRVHVQSDSERLYHILTRKSVDTLSD